MEPTEPRADGLIASLICHYDDLVKYVGWRFGDADFARDVVHQVCADLLDRPEPAGVRQPLAFLRRVLRNHAIDCLRGDTRRAHLVEALAACPIQDCHEDAATYLNGLQAVEDLAAVIQGLPDRPRQIFILHRLYDMSKEAIACELGVSRNTVAKHYRQAVLSICSLWVPAQGCLNSGRPSGADGASCAGPCSSAKEV